MFPRLWLTCKWLGLGLNDFFGLGSGLRENVIGLGLGLNEFFCLGLGLVENVSGLGLNHYGSGLGSHFSVFF